MNTKKHFDFSSFFGAIAQVKANLIERKERALDKVSELNGGVRPNIDEKGRMHAPFDGYRDPHDRVYNGGEFMASLIEEADECGFEFSPKEFSFPKSKARVKTSRDAAVAVYEQSLDLNTGITVSYGESWKENGIDVCYAYVIDSNKTIENAFIAAMSKFAPNEREAYLNDGVHTVTGKIVSRKLFNGDYVAWKMLVVLDGGEKLYGTAPAAVSENDVQRTITFTANFQAGKNGFTYYKRPRKISLS
jgi:hypothetical protein